MKQLKGLKNQLGFWGAIASTVLGSMLDGGGGGAPAASQQGTGSFGLTGDGLFSGTNFDSSTGTINTQLSPQQLQMMQLSGDQSQQFGNAAMSNPYSQQAFGLGQGFMSQLAGTDYLGLQNSLYQQQAGLLQPQFDQQNLDMEGRLFAQGRLGSVPGANQQQALLQSQNNTFGQLLANAFQQSQGAQAQTAGLATNFLNQGQGLQANYQNMGNAANLNLFNQNTALNQSLQTAGGLTQYGTATGVDNSMTSQQALGGGLLTGGVQGITAGLNSLFQPNSGLSTPGTSPGTYSQNSLFQNGYVGGF